MASIEDLLKDKGIERPKARMRSKGRDAQGLREVRIQRGYSMHAMGSCLIEMGNTKVICAANIEERVPPYLRRTGRGWLTAEYGMIPSATNTRMPREASRGGQKGRTQEIQRLIGRSLRATIDMTLLGEKTIWIDCDVIQADGGTRTASITGAYVALKDAVSTMLEKGLLAKTPMINQIAAVSVGIIDNELLLDLDYAEDSNADVDMNVIMTDAAEIIEVQGTAEGAAFSRQQMEGLMDFAQKGILELITMQKKTLEEK